MSHRHAGGADKIGVLRQQRRTLGEVFVYQQYDRKRVEALLRERARLAAADAFVLRAEPFADHRLHRAEPRIREQRAEPGGVLLRVAEKDCRAVMLHGVKYLRAADLASVSREDHGLLPCFGRLGAEALERADAGEDGDLVVGEIFLYQRQQAEYPCVAGDDDRRVAELKLLAKALEGLFEACHFNDVRMSRGDVQMARSAGDRARGGDRGAHRRRHLFYIARSGSQNVKPISHLLSPPQRTARHQSRRELFRRCR